MKKLLYLLYALIFNVSRLFFKVKENRIALISMHNENFRDSLGSVYNYLKEKNRYDFVLITREDLSLKKPLALVRFFFVKARLLATSKYVFLNDNFMPLGYLNFSKDTVVTQLWHGEGAFKKIGLDIPQPDSVRKREIACAEKTDFLICSSKNLMGIYSKAFGIPEEKILPLGAPRADYILTKENACKARENFERLYPKAKGKKVMLYAPTFRDEKEQDERLLDSFDAERLLNEFSDEYEIFIRLHPQVHSSTPSFEGITDVTEYEDVRELLLATDVLITDYSSICMDFSLLERKTVFYCPDLEWYRQRRDFYIDYERDIPGPMAQNTEELIEALRLPFDRERNARFRDYNFDFTDTCSTKRVAEKIVR